MAYIIGSYNKYDSWDRTHAIYKFQINEWWYAVYEVDMVWGLPALKFQIDQDDDPQSYFIWESREDAIQFAQEQKSRNRR